MSARRAAVRQEQGSVLDRLLEDPEEDPSQGLSLVALRDGLRRDLEAILNTRRRFISWPESLEQLDHSLVNFGLSDFTNSTLKSDDFQKSFIREVQEIIHHFEPRIFNFEVSVIENKDEFDRTLRFRISGMVTLGAERQQISFDSHVDPVRCVVVRD